MSGLPIGAMHSASHRASPVALLCHKPGSTTQLMSSEKEDDSPSADTTGFVCGIEASALLNCVAGKQYSEAKCKPLLQKLRACIEKKKVLKFSLLPDEDSSTKKPGVDEKDSSKRK